MTFFGWMWSFFGLIWVGVTFFGLVWLGVTFCWFGVGGCRRVWPNIGWVWVSVTIYWLCWLGVGECGLFLTGCGWVTFSGWVWVRVTFSWLGVGGHGWVDSLWLPSIYGYYQVHPINPFYYRFMFSKINFELTLFSYQMNYYVGHFRVYLRR